MALLDERTLANIFVTWHKNRLAKISSSTQSETIVVDAERNRIVLRPGRGRPNHETQIGRFH